jgi:hypothetical protein
LIGHKESDMAINPKPGNQPDPDDMAAAFDADGEPGSPAPSHLEEEEEAAKLGDFA